MSRSHNTAPAITITAGKGDPPVAYFEAVWHEPQPSGPSKPAKQRIGRAWVDFVGRDERGRALWSKRRGRVPDGYYDERRAHAASAAAVARWRERQAARLAPADEARSVTFRRVAEEWLVWLRDVKGASPATIRDYASLLREPGTPHRRGKGVSAGRIMGAFGDRPPPT